MRNGDAASEHLKSRSSNCIEIADRAVRDDSHASERLQNIRVNFADKGAPARTRIDILNYYDPRRGHGKDVLPPVRSLVQIAAAFHWRVGRSNARGGRVANDRRQVVEDAANAGIGESGVG